ncbi:SDR family oxidoreductase [Pelagibacterium sp.]|uniref:SDR family oxidoreductase n=1 Tax=Pelagibacterium sp. TaxID=1967288 RepID=UPI003BA914B1
MELAGKVALVTGGGSGLGRASAIKLASEGADIAVLSRTMAEVDAVALEITRLGRRALPLYADISDVADMQAAFDQITETFGRLDIVFANAGINGTWAPLEDLAVDDWDRTIAVNLRGTFLTLHHAIPLMKERGGSIVITSSINGTRTFTTAGASAYSTTKAGQLALAQMAALELAKYRIRVNAVCPGAIESQIEENTERRNLEKAGEPALYPDGDIPLTDGAPGKAEDVAQLVSFLASDASRHITGTPVWIDGAQSLLV